MSVMPSASREPWFELGADATKLTLLRLIDADPMLSQHQLGMAAGVSLGTVNVYVKQMLTEGWLRVEGSNHKVLRYFLTPAGLVASQRLWRRQAQEVAGMVDVLQQDLAGTLRGWHNMGIRRLAIAGDSIVAQWVLSAVTMVDPAWRPTLVRHLASPTAEAASELEAAQIDAVALAVFEDYEPWVRWLAPLAKRHRWRVFRL